MRFLSYGSLCDLGGSVSVEKLLLVFCVIMLFASRENIHDDKTAPRVPAIRNWLVSHLFSPLGVDFSQSSPRVR